MGRTPQGDELTPRSSRTGVWSVSHHDLTTLASSAVASAAPVPPVPEDALSPAELVTVVSFFWNHHATSCYVTGTFSNWESTIPMSNTHDNHWQASKALPPGDYQYKFIVDNVWRHAPDQPVVYDERGIINNHLTVQLESCGDVACFCYRIAVAAAKAAAANAENNATTAPPHQQQQPNAHAPAATPQFGTDHHPFSDQHRNHHIHSRHASDNDSNNSTSIVHAQSPGSVARMTPRTERRMAKATGVAYKYVEKVDRYDYPNQMQRSIMHTHINDRPFEVSVVNVSNLATKPAIEPNNPDLADGMMSRVSSWEDLSVLRQRNSDSAFDLDDNYNAQQLERLTRSRYAPAGLPWNEDAAYAAALRNNEQSSLPRTAAGRATMLQSDPTELAFSIRARFSSPLLGFDPKESHPGILLTEANQCATRVQERGLYKTARSVLPLPVDRDLYMEIYIHKSSSTGGVCFGLSTRELPLTCLVGARPNSIGWSTSGNLLRTIDGKETWTKLGCDIGPGTTIGMLVHLGETVAELAPHHSGGGGGGDGGCDGSGSSGDSAAANGDGAIATGTDTLDDPNTSDSPAAPTLVTRKVRVEYFVDGKSIGAVDDFSFLGGHMDVFPTLSLFARNARVYALFNAGDMLHPPPFSEDRPIFTVDGNRVARTAQNTPKTLGFDQ